MSKIFIVGGGTGGHLFPAISIYQELINRNYRNVHLITDDRCIKYLTKYHIPNLHIINSSGIKSGLMAKILAILKVFRACIQTFILFFKEKPSILVTFGGYTSFAPLLSAKIFGIPVIMHEQNCFLGKVNKLFASNATILMLTFEDTKNLPKIDRSKIIVSGNPVRQEILQTISNTNYQINPFKILIMGGSQGASIFSDLLPAAIEIILKQHTGINLEIIQQASKTDQIKISNFYNKYNIQHEISDFFTNINNHIASAHLVIARSGASTVAELIALTKPSILIPYPYAAENHQYFNAEFIVKHNGGLLFKQSDLNAQTLADQILFLYNNRDILADYSQNLAILKKDSVNIITNALEKIIAS